jgi:predicted nucleic acid-binding protein
VILADTSVWIDHLRAGDRDLVHLLDAGEVVGHPMVAGELALGHLKQPAEVLALFRSLPGAPEASHDEVLSCIERHVLAGSGLGWVDAHLLTSALLGSTPLWTRDRILASVARRVGVSAT